VKRGGICGKLSLSAPGESRRTLLLSPGVLLGLGSALLAVGLTLCDENFVVDSLSLQR